MTSDKDPESVMQVEGRDEMSDSKDMSKVDTVHNDEALRVIAGYQGNSEWTEQEEKKLRRKVDWKLMPVLCMTYGLQYYDKAMLSQAVSDCGHLRVRSTMLML